MRCRPLILLFCLLLPILAEAQDYERLDTLLQRFYVAMIPESVEAKVAEYDALISSCADSLTRQRVALDIFDHYKNDPPVMGEEEVALHIYDRWIASGRIKTRGEIEALEADMFADFNRSTMLGCEAPAVCLKRPCGRPEVLPGRGRTSILFFFDTSCDKCKAEISVFPKALSGLDFNVDFYAVYCGQDKKSWRRFRRSFSLGSSFVKVHHLWDPELDSDYLKLYGVISTPRIYMTEPGGLVIGRRLEPETLPQMFPLAKKIQEAYEKTKQN